MLEVQIRRVIKIFNFYKTWKEDIEKMIIFLLRESSGRSPTFFVATKSSPFIKMTLSWDEMLRECLLCQRETYVPIEFVWGTFLKICCKLTPCLSTYNISKWLFGAEGKGATEAGCIIEEVVEAIEEVVEEIEDSEDEEEREKDGGVLETEEDEEDISMGDDPEALVRAFGEGFGGRSMAFLAIGFLLCVFGDRRSFLREEGGGWFFLW